MWPMLLDLETQILEITFSINYLDLRARQFLTVWFFVVTSTLINIVFVKVEEYNRTKTVIVIICNNANN